MLRNICVSALLALAVVSVPNTVMGSQTTAPCPGGWSHGGGGGGGLHAQDCIGGSAELAGGEVVVGVESDQIAGVITFTVPELCRSKQPVVIDVRIPKYAFAARLVMRSDAGAAKVFSPPINEVGRLLIEADLSTNTCRAELVSEFDALRVNE
jgi:hypothetical protein